MSRGDRRAAAPRLAVLLLVWFASASCSGADASTRERTRSPGPGTVAKNAADSSGFRLVAPAGEFSAEELDRMRNSARMWRDRLVRLVGRERAPADPILIRFGGDGRRIDASRNYPHVNARGEIVLFRYTDQNEDYLDSFLHELVHAFRFRTGPRLSGFIEEGFAQAVDLEIGPRTYRFPTYGFALDSLAAGLIRTAPLPLEVLRDHHRPVNLDCQIQAYVSRASFFDALRREFGLEALIELAYDPSSAGGDPFQRRLGVDFSRLVDEWRAALLANYEPDAAIRTWDRYRESTPARRWDLCSATYIADFAHPTPSTGF